MPKQSKALITWKEQNLRGGISSMVMCAGLILLLTGISIAQSRDLKTRAKERPTNMLAQEMLTLHNAIRAYLKLPHLQWSRELAAYSQKWADALLAKNLSQHNSDSPYGENIFVTGAGSTPYMAVKEWASESRDYSYETNSCNGDCGHYTQLVWRNTQKVGCGVARGSERDIWVCSYDPPGNYVGERPY
jgi:pathogenesis-related protein 1